MGPRRRTRKKKKKKKYLLVPNEDHEEIVGTQIAFSVREEEAAEEEEEETEEEQHAAITPATANRNKEKFRLHQMCADGDVRVHAWLRRNCAFQSNNNKKPHDCEEDGDDNDREERKSLVFVGEEVFASGTPAATGQTWPPPPVKEIFDSKTGRKLTPDLENAANDDGDDEENDKEKNEDVNGRDDNGNTPLAIASALSDREASASITEALLSNEHIDVFGFCDGDGFNAVHWACKIGNSKTLEILLTHEQSLVDFRADDLKCSTPAMVASKYAQLECLSVLKAFRCNINMRDIYGTQFYTSARVNSER